MARIPGQAGGGASEREVFRLRGRIRVTNPFAPLRMTAMLWTLALLLRPAWATTYYVSSSTGNDANSGTSASAAWQTIGHVNGQTFQPGDSILFERGDVWNESLIPPSSGSSGSPITFDAYGSGPAPNLTGYYAVPSSAWVLVSENAWKAPLPATYNTVNFCLFGSIWGQKVPASTANLTAQWDFYFANGYVYVFSEGNPGAFYDEPIVPMALSNVPVINVNGKSWLTVQHFLVNWFDQYGVYVQGASDHLAFANMESDAMIPQGTQPLGFYVNESSPGPGDIKIYDDEAHLNYDGFRFDGAATAITMINDKAYANRDGALVDDTGAVSYSYCHFYASSLAVAGSTDVEWTSGSGPTAGAGNIAADTPPAVQVWQRYPARVTLTVDDIGMTPGADTYYEGTVLPIADAAAVPVGTAITVGYTATIDPIISEIQGWINGGRDVTSHSISHTYYPNTDALDIQYTGSGVAATLTISHDSGTCASLGVSSTACLVINAPPDSVGYDLAQGRAEGTIKLLRLALLATGKFTATENPTCQGPYGTGCSSSTETALLSQDLADVSGQDVKSAVYSMLLDTTRLTTDEITLSRQWMTSNLTGLPATPVYVYPGGYETPTMQGIAASVPYLGARGALKEDLGVKDTYADGFNVQNITSFGVNPSWMGLDPAVLNEKVEALVWKEQVWGVPWGIFWHWNATNGAGELSAMEVTNLISDLRSSGATIQTNTSLVNWLLGGTQETGTDGNSYYKFPAASAFSANGALDFRPTAASPVVDAGENLGAAYELDINGVNQNSYGSGWEIGAHAFIGYATYGKGGSGSGNFTIGGGNYEADDNTYCPANEVAAYPGGASTDGPATLPQTCVNTAVASWTQPATVKWICPSGQTIPTDSPDGRGGQACDYTTVGAALTAMPGNGCGVWYKVKSTNGTSLANEPAGTQNVYAENNLTIPAGVTCTAASPVWITTDQYLNLAETGLGEGQRATPGWVGTLSGSTTLFPAFQNPVSAGVYFPKIRNSAVNASTLTTDTSTAYLRVGGIEFTSASDVAIDNRMLTLYGDHVVVDRSIVHCGDSPTMTSVSFCSAGVAPLGTYIAVVNSYIANFECSAANGYGVCPEGHGISWGSNTTLSREGPVKIVNNFVSASGENILSGGSATNFVPTDAEIRRNYFYKPLYWDSDCNLDSGTAGATAGVLPTWCADPYGNPEHAWNVFEISSITCSGGTITASSTLPAVVLAPIAGTSKVTFQNVEDANFDQGPLLVATSSISSGVLTLTAATTGACDPSSSGGQMAFGGAVIKNQLEFKNEQRALIEGNTFENLWWGDSDQFGEAIVFNAIGNGGDSVLVTVQDVTYRYNVVQHANKGLLIGAEINLLTGIRHEGSFSIHDNVFDDLDGSKWAPAGDSRYSIGSAWGSLPYNKQQATVASAAGSLNCSGGVVTASGYYGISSPPFVAGDGFNLSGASPIGFNGGPFALLSASSTTLGGGYPLSTFTWNVGSCPAASGSGGSMLGTGPGGAPYNISLVHNTFLQHTVTGTGAGRMAMAGLSDNSNLPLDTGMVTIDSTGTMVTLVTGSGFKAGCGNWGIGGGWVGGPFILDGIGSYPISSAPACPTASVLYLSTPATSVAGTTVNFTAPCPGSCTDQAPVGPWSGIVFDANIGAGMFNPTDGISSGGSANAANAYFVSTSCGTGAGGATNVCWCASDNIVASQETTNAPDTLPYPSANPTGNHCANVVGGNNQDAPDHTLGTVGFANYNSGSGGDYVLCTGAGTPDALCTAASPFWNSTNSSWGTFDGLAYGADIGKVKAYTSGPPPR